MWVEHQVHTRDPKDSFAPRTNLNDRNLLECAALSLCLCCKGGLKLKESLRLIQFFRSHNPLKISLLIPNFVPLQILERDLRKSRGWILFILSRQQ